MQQARWLFGTPLFLITAVLSVNQARAQTAAPQTAGTQPAGAQASDDPQVNILITAQRKQFGPPDPKPRRCAGTAANGEILVCGADRGEDIRVPSTADSDPFSRQGMDDGLPRAPMVSGLPDCSRGCIGVGSVPPPLYVINVKELPEAPKDSDAEKVANGELADR